MFGLFKKYSIPIKEKDPKDFTLTESSTGWDLDRHYCRQCLKSTCHSEYMSDVCNGCGGFNTQDGRGRSFRKIFYQGVWQYQIKYKEGKEEIIKEWYS